MTPTEINAAIAELCGWVNIRFVSGEPMGRPPKTTDRYEVVANYYGDLNATHEAEVQKELHHYPKREQYYPLLIEVTNRIDGKGYPLWMATAPQRCEAFLRLHGRWVEV